MLAPGILGFQGLFFLVFVLIAYLVIREKLRNAAARKEEIMRLVVQASEESAMAEVEATVEYGSISLTRRYQCAVCYCPTTTRCSQCKAVRYCSSKCQIIHWRQGHKDECHPPITTMQLKDGKDNTENVASSMEPEVQGTSSGSADMSSNEVVWTTTTEKPRKMFSKNADSNRGTLTGDSKLHVGRPSNSDLTSNVQGSSSAHNFDKLKSFHTDEEFNSKSQAAKMKRGTSEDFQDKKVCRKPSRGNAVSEKLVQDACKERSSKSRVDTVDNIMDHSRSSKEVGSLASKSSQAHPLETGDTLVVSSISTKSNENHGQSAGIGSLPSLEQNTCKSLKTSMKKVVQQFRVPKHSNSNLINRMNETSGKYKVVFPYDLFVKLYSCDEVKLRPFGLVNCGNSCYANAVLQCLAFTRPLTSYLLQGLHSKACRKKEWCFICEFESLIVKAEDGKFPQSPIGILSRIHKIGSHLGHGREEDAHEFLRYAVDTMQLVCLKETGLVGPLAEETTLVGLTFGGYLRSKIKCLKCHGKSERFERMMDLTVEIDGEIRTLEEALTQFTATEVLDRDNRYHCSRCKSYEKAKKKLNVLEAPNVLTIVLKRFQSGSFEKLNKSVQFPEILNLAPYMSGSSDRCPIYSLYAVVVHLDVSNAAFSGHYVCYVKDTKGEWFRIDDSAVTPVDLDRVLLEGAYMLLYARNSPRPPASVRNNVLSQTGKYQKQKLKAFSSYSINSKTKPCVTASGANISLGQKKLSKYPAIYYSSDPTSSGHTSIQRFCRTDSSSESSSIFSSSDASSCSTVSNKDSSGTEDFSDYIFGDAGSNWHSDYGFTSDAGASCSYHNREAEETGRRQPWEGKSSAFFHAETSRHRRKSTSELTCRRRDADYDHSVYANYLDENSGVLRRLSEDRSARTYC